MARLGLLTITGVGTVMLGASQLATADYTTATATASFTVNPETPTLTFAAIPSKNFGDPAFTVSASSASSGAVTYSVTSGPASINSSTGLLTLTGAGTVVLGASQAASGNYTGRDRVHQLHGQPCIDHRHRRNSAEWRCEYAVLAIAGGNRRARAAMSGPPIAPEYPAWQE